MRTAMQGRSGSGPEKKAAHVQQPAHQNSHTSTGIDVCTEDGPHRLSEKLCARTPSLKGSELSKSKRPRIQDRVAELSPELSVVL